MYMCSPVVGRISSNDKEMMTYVVVVEEGTWTTG